MKPPAESADGDELGAPPSALCRPAHSDFSAQIAELTRIAGARGTPAAERIRAIEVLARVGLDRGASIEDALRI